MLAYSPHSLARTQEGFSSQVVEIIDHHKDESLYQDSVVASKRTIEMVGSAATLVAEKVCCVG